MQGYTNNKDRTSIADKRITDTIIKDAKLTVESLLLVTDRIEFEARATVYRGLTPQMFYDAVFRIRDEQQHWMTRFREEITKERENRNDIIEGSDNAIVAKRAEISATESRLALLQKELDILEEVKAKEVLDKKKVCDKAEALYDLAMHCFGTIRACADFAIQSGDDVMQAANNLVNKHLDLQIAYNNGKYEKLLESKGGEVKKQLFQRK